MRLDFHPYTKILGPKPERIVIPVSVFKPIAGEAPQSTQIEALWDTGSSHTYVSPAVVEKLGLDRIDEWMVDTFDGRVKYNVYEMGLELLDGAGTATLQVGSNERQGIDMIIGLDVMQHLDFALTHTPDGDMVFSFRIPPAGFPIIYTPLF